MDTEIDVTDIQPPSTAFETGALVAIVLAIVLLTAGCAAIALLIP
jgi:hypothetical protein